MSKVGVVFLGLVLFAVGAGVLAYRLNNDPDILVRYERALLDPDGVSKKTMPSRQPDDGAGGSETGGPTPESVGAAKELAGLKMFEILLDLANVFIGLVGIGLAISGLRMRSQARRA